ncbi:MAG: MBOAT family O-acyltransferase [Myxococcota bacterium]
MLFNSLEFIIFFAVVGVGYAATSRSLFWQNTWLLAGSIVFYGFWDWRFLFLVASNVVVVHLAASRIVRPSSRRKAWLALAVVFNLGVLAFFKYANFFVDSATEFLALIGLTPDRVTIKIILPVGISFYTFQALSYVVDVYRGDVRPARSVRDLALYVLFFPQLVAGPIERARTFLPQILTPRRVSSAQVQVGIGLIIGGYFKKIVVADNLALVANPVFDNFSQYAGLETLAGVVAFALQIYADFSAYSDIARGVAKLLGFELMVNFKQPYFAINPSDFWLRWHISLSSWLRDYLYIPLGGNRGGRFATQRNLMITMVLGGLWHGAAWNFVIWGVYHGALLALYRAFDRQPEHLDPWSGRWHPTRILGKMVLMAGFTLFGWVIFRSQSIAQLGGVVGQLFSPSTKRGGDFWAQVLVFGSPVMVSQLAQYVTRDLAFFTRMPAVAQGAVYGAMLLAMVVLGVREPVEFIYFQF